MLLTPCRIPVKQEEISGERDFGDIGNFLIWESQENVHASLPVNLLMCWDVRF